MAISMHLLVATRCAVTRLPDRRAFDFVMWFRHADAMHYLAVVRSPSNAVLSREHSTDTAQQLTPVFVTAAG